MLFDLSNESEILGVSFKVHLKHSLLLNFLPLQFYLLREDFFLRFVLPTIPILIPFPFLFLFTFVALGKTDIHLRARAFIDSRLHEGILRGLGLVLNLGLIDHMIVRMLFSMEREMVIGEMAALVHATEKKRGDNENNKVIHSESYLGVEVILVVALERHV